MPCPICERDPDPKYRPFCSRRCADVDLGRWLTGKYAVTSQREEDAEEVQNAIEQENAKLH